MGDIVPMNRRARRARLAERRREDRHEAAHVCAVDVDAKARGHAEVRIGIALFHDLHRVLGEPWCPKCPTCIGLRRAGKIDGRQPRRALTMGMWLSLLNGEIAP